jgi:thymidylate synthase
MIPVIHVEGNNIPEVWELSLCRLWDEGVEMPTEYENSPSSLDCTMIQVVQNPFNEPRYHKKLPTSFEGLEEYRKEVVEGFHNEYVGKGWNYSYNHRLTEYFGLNQLQKAIDKLATNWYTRRALVMTWDPKVDLFDSEAPCFQQANFRIDTGNTLNMTTYWRSRDAFKAAFMNMIAFTDLQRYVAEEVSKKLGSEIKVGQYTDISNSYHLYSRYNDEFEKFLQSMKDRPFEARTMTSNKFNLVIQNLDEISKEK